MHEDSLLHQAKLAARLHDPAEKALVLMRTQAGHEGGSVRRLRERLALQVLPERIEQAVRQADQWASAMDRAAFPNRDSDGRYPAWQRVRFDQDPVIIHPLTGDAFRLDRLTEVQPEQAQALSQGHFETLIHADPQRTALAFWRFGPEIDAPEVRSLWSLLPADTRVPDHDIFSHLDLTAALAGAFTLDPKGGPALLAVSLGPVQEFIAAARSSSDLWAGSHLLSRIAWEAMKVICEELGPEAILLPRLRGVPQVDLWLRDDKQLDAALFESCDWTRSRSDANPLFAAALPNRFTALVPADRARSLAERITSQVRAWVLARGESAFRLLLREAGVPDAPSLPGYAQLREQLDGFPEVHWAAVPWSLAGTDADGRVDADAPTLAEAMQPFFENRPPGFLGGTAWRLLSGGLELEAGNFWRPNPGALYPALHELLERSLAAAKSVRPFRQSGQAGWRDSLGGEAEWLTTDRSQLDLPPGQRADTLWTRVAAKRPGWVKSGSRTEHLAALGTLKRLWPTLYVRELGDLLEDMPSRFVVSTHTMALAGSLARAVKGQRELPKALIEAVEQAAPQRVALPRKLAGLLREHPDKQTLARLPGWLEQARESADDAVLRRAEGLLADYLGHRPEAYYALLLMDGDRMGAWLSADDALTLPHQASFHPQIRNGLQAFAGDPRFRDYAASPRAPSPSRHMAISEALNNFALSLAPAVTEERFHGRVLYAGGDDLMAMLPVVDLLPAMAGLRAAYAGIDAAAIGAEGLEADFRRQANGFVLHRKRLLRVMGEKATASCGVVIAHHQAPLGAVLRELRVAERRAKDDGGRDAFCLTLVKRSGGSHSLTARWGDAFRLLQQLCRFLAEPDVSRRAVYHADLWLKDLPEPEGDGAMAAQLLAYQLQQQTGSPTTRQFHDLHALAGDLVRLSIERNSPQSRLPWLSDFLHLAEFLAREGRAGA